MENEKLVLSVKEVADLLGVSNIKVYELLRMDNGIPHIRFGKNYKISRKQLEAWIEKSSIQGMA